MGEPSAGEGSSSRSGRGRGGGGGRGGGRGFGGRGRGRGRGGGGGGGEDRGGERRGQGEGEEAPKRWHADKYRPRPLPEPLMRAGISMTGAQHKENQAERELLKALEEAADELYPETAEGFVKAEEENENPDADLELMLQQELATLTDTNKMSNRFQLCRQEVMCASYINVLPPLDPVRLVRHVLERIERTAMNPFRFVQRIVPISATCHADLDDMRRIAADVFAHAFKTPDNTPLRFAVQTNTRHSSKLDRMSMIKTCAECVGKLGQGHIVDLKNPQMTILVELYKSGLGLGVVEDYERFKKLNPSQVAQAAARAADPNYTPAPKKEVEEGEVGKAPAKHANRDARVAKMAEVEAERGHKRKASEMERNAILLAEEEEEANANGVVPETEEGELNEAPAVPNSALEEEIISNGTSTKILRTE